MTWSSPLNAQAKPACPVLVSTWFALLTFEIQNQILSALQPNTSQKRPFYSSASKFQPLWGTNKPHLLWSLYRDSANPACHSLHQPSKSESDFKNEAASGDRPWGSMLSPCAPAITDRKYSLNMLLKTPECTHQSPCPTFWLPTQKRGSFSSAELSFSIFNQNIHVEDKLLENLCYPLQLSWLRNFTNSMPPFQKQLLYWLLNQTQLENLSQQAVRKLL